MFYFSLVQFFPWWCKFFALLVCFGANFLWDRCTLLRPVTYTLQSGFCVRKQGSGTQLSHLYGIQISIFLIKTYLKQNSINSMRFCVHCMRIQCIAWLMCRIHLMCKVATTCGRGLKGVCLLHLLSENIFPVLRSNWFYVLMKQEWIWNLSLCYFSLFCFYLTGYDARTAERKNDSTWRTWYKQTLRVYHSRRPISWLIPEMQYPVIYIIKFSNN